MEFLSCELVSDHQYLTLRFRDPQPTGGLTFVVPLDRQQAEKLLRELTQTLEPRS